MKTEASIDCLEFRNSITNYLERELSPESQKSIEQHKQECEGCEEFLSQIQLTIEALGSMKRQRSSETIPKDLLFAFRKWKRRSGEECAIDVEDTIHTLQTLSGPSFRTAVKKVPADMLLALGQMAIDEAGRMGVVEPSKARSYARVAVGLFEQQVNRGHEGGQLPLEKLAQAWAVLGNAKRICSDFRGAGVAFTKSERLLERISRHSVTRATVLQLKSVYLAESGMLAEALVCIDEVIAVYQTAGESHLVGRALISKGSLAGPFGEPSAAAEDLKSGLKLIDPEREPRLTLVAKHNLIHSLIECGRRHDALKILDETRESHICLDNPIDLVRFKWLEGKIALDLGNLDSAEELLLQVKEFFVEQEMSHDVAVVSLDLALVYLKQTRTVELKELANEMVTIFGGLGIRREIFAALAFFNRAQEIEQTATMNLLQDLIELLEGARQRGAFRPQLGMPGQI